MQAGLTRRLEPGTWHAMATTLTFGSPGTATVEAFIDGVSYDRGTFAAAALPEGDVELRLGADYAAAAWTPAVLDLDDVSFDAK